MSVLATFSKVINTRRISEVAGRQGWTWLGSIWGWVGLYELGWIRSGHCFSVVGSGQICRPITVNGRREKFTLNFRDVSVH